MTTCVDQGYTASVGKFGGFALLCAAIFASSSARAGEGRRLACEMPEEQSDSLTLSPLKKLPAVVRAYDDGGSAPSRSAAKALQGAIDEWNAFGRRAVGGDLFHLAESDDTDPLFLDEDYAWLKRIDHPIEVHFNSGEIPWGASTLGLTQQFSIDEFAIFERIFVARLVSAAQLQSILLHELGHALGLGHSCLLDSQEEGGPIECADLPKVHAYREAVLFPFLINDEKKEKLRENDRTRAVCTLENSVVRSR